MNDQQDTVVFHEEATPATGYVSAPSLFPPARSSSPLPGDEVEFTDGARYRVAQDGSWRKTAGKPISKKARRRLKNA